MIWLVFAFLAGAAVMSVLAPLARKARASDPAASDVAFFKEQVREIERESADSRLAPEDAETAKIEAARRLLRAQSSPDRAAVSSRRNAIIAALAAIVLIPGLSLSLYARLGHSEMPDAPLQARRDAVPPRLDVASAVARIEAHLAAHPDDGRGFEVVAPFYLSDGRAADAVHAFSEALRLLGATAQRHASLGEARVSLSQGAVSAEARRDFEAALALDPSSRMARYYLGLAAAQNGERDKAIDIWSKLLSEAPPGAPWSERLRAQLEQLQGAPRAALPQASEQGAQIAALPDREREAVIRSMVDRLKGKLEKDGDDVEGWLKLIRAYSVLAEGDKARSALSRARKALAKNKEGLARIDALAQELEIGG